MSYMNSNLAACPVGGVQELTFDEVDAINGGLVWVPAAIYLGGVVIGFGLAAAADYLNGGFDD